MKATILVIILICGCVVSTYSQINQRRKGDTKANNPSSFRHAIKPAFGYKELIKPKALWDEKTIDSFLPRDGWYARAQAKAHMQESMPCYKPEGIFSMRIIKPDSRIEYTMLFKKVLEPNIR